jgi:hypothetical protein
MVKVRILAECGFADITPSPNTTDANGNPQRGWTVLHDWITQDWAYANRAKRPNEPALGLKQCYCDYVSYLDLSAQRTLIDVPPDPSPSAPTANRNQKRVFA